MKNGDVVIYTESGKSYVATVLGVRELEFHSGKDNEPLLHLGFYAPVHESDGTGKKKEANLVGTHRQVELSQIRLDVAHETHEFPAHLKAPTYPGGRWRGPVLTEEDIEVIGLKSRPLPKSPDTGTLSEAPDTGTVN